MNKKIIITLLLIFVSSYFLKVNESDILVSSNTKSNLISISINNGDGEYELYDDNTFPSDGYIFNDELSYCVNGAELTWSGDKIIIKTIGNDSCNLYFDTNKINLAEAILEDNGGINYIISKDKPDFTNIATTNEGMYSINDDYGISYYYRGDADNWLYFGEYYWRIIRIDGNGNIRILYNGDDINLTNTLVFENFVFNTFNDNASYAGFNYTYDVYRGTDTKSNALNSINSWYHSNLYPYQGSMAYGYYCIDRTGYSDQEGIYEKNTLSSPLYYGSNIRVENAIDPQLKCPVSDDIYTSYIGGALSMDEVILAGGNLNTQNEDYYIYGGNSQWTLSPSSYLGKARVFVVGDNGSLRTDAVDELRGIRPVITINSGVKVELSGNGSSIDPYVVVYD